MQVKTSDGKTIDAGNFTAPQGASVLRVDTNYQSFQETIPRTYAYPNDATLYGGELMVWASGECSRVTTSTSSTITSSKLINMNLKGIQGEAGGDSFCKLSAISGVGTDLNLLASIDSNPNVFCANFILSDVKPIRFALVVASLTVQTNLVYLQIMRSVINKKWTFYLGIAYDNSKYTFVFGDLGANTTGFIRSMGDPISLYGAYFKY